MKIKLNFITFVWLIAAGATAFADDDWQSALSQMPLGVNATELNRTNCVPLMLGAFQSNGVVKALIFMPGATDEIYFFKRVHAELTNASPSLLDAVTTLTNQTCIQATFQPPFLLLHTTEDSLDGFATIKNESTAAKLRERRVPGLVLLNDNDWDGVQSVLHKKLKIRLSPSRGSSDSWHFYRHSFAACDVTEWEMLETLALAGKTTFTLHWLTADFQPDRREGPVPKPETLSVH
jgi:hypothetical protein